MVIISGNPLSVSSVKITPALAKSDLIIFCTQTESATLKWSKPFSIL
ncbi:MAG: hypothetical protein ACD_82C00019G0002 [uncultured bacterium]|nr:MAG: hypothetical protein ACD_82C00019G0002 [uncultured bacterium]